MRRLSVTMATLIVLLGLAARPGDAAPPAAGTPLAPAGVVGGSTLTFT